MDPNPCFMLPLYNSLMLKRLVTIDYACVVMTGNSCPKSIVYFFLRYYEGYEQREQIANSR